MADTTLIIREAQSLCQQPFAATGKPWGLFVRKVGRRFHEVGHFETRDQAVSLAKIIAEARGDVRIE